MVDTEYRLESDRTQYIMRGVVDVLADTADADAGQREIWDYKGSNRPDASDPTLQDYIWQMCVYAELYRVRTGSYPRRAILYFINELRSDPGEPPPTRRPPRAVFEVDFSDPTVIQAALGPLTPPPPTSWPARLGRIGRHRQRNPTREPAMCAICGGLADLDQEEFGCLFENTVTLGKVAFEACCFSDICNWIYMSLIRPFS